MGDLKAVRRVRGASDYEQVGPGLWADLPAVLLVRDVPSEGRALVYEVDQGGDGRVHIKRVGMESLDGSRITSADWRAANPFEVWETVGLQLIKTAHPIDQGTRYKPLGEESVEVVANLRSRGPGNPATLQAVADAYNAATALGIPASKHVQRV